MTGRSQLRRACGVMGTGEDMMDTRDRKQVVRTGGLLGLGEGDGLLESDVGTQTRRVLVSFCVYLPFLGPAG